MRPLFFFLALFALTWHLPRVGATEPRFFDDAAVRAIQFVDEREGWAVGDDGVIWHSIDGGNHWERQSSGVRASLRSLHFLTPFVGWIVGREELPGGGSAGVVLHTRDGGVKWKRILVNSLPGLHLVRFVDDKTGYIAGDGSDQFPSGVFATTDSGRNWYPVPGSRATSWRAGDFNAEGGALAGAWNRLATVRRAQLFTLDMDSLGGRTICGVQLRGNDGFAVGQGGLVLASRKTRGSSWDYVDLKIPLTVRNQMDFHAVHGVGDHVWVVGRPGSVLLNSGDRGKTWRLVRSGQTMPLHGVFFLNDKKGWAVGELGTILKTTDGGNSWQVATRGGQRLAVLCINGRPGSTPLDTIAQLGAEEGYLTTNLCVTGPEPKSAELSRVGEACRFAAACRTAGGACGEMLWAFPLGSHLAKVDQDKLLTAWNRLHGGNAPQQLLAQIILAIRMYRPDVIITDNVELSATGHAIDALVAEAVREAFRQAGDPKAMPTQLETMGLSVHKAKKLYALSGKNASALVQIDTTSPSPRLQSTVREFSTTALSLLELGAPPTTRHYRLLADDLPGATSHRDLMQGIALAPGGVARRKLTAVEELSRETLKALRQRTNLMAMAETPVEKLASPERLLAQIGPMLEGLPMDGAARVAHGLARQYARRGQWSLARETFMLLVEKYPTHPLAVEGYRWLLLHQASSEARRRHEVGQFLLLGQTQHGLAGDLRKAPEVGNPLGIAGAKGPKLPDLPEFNTKKDREMAYIGGVEEMRRWYQGCLALEKKLSAFGPLQAYDPSIQFAVQAARRQLGDVETATKWYRDLIARQNAGPWRLAAMTELWLMNRSGAPPRPVMTTRPTETRPYLDGKLNEACWKQAKVVQLINAVGETNTTHKTEVRMTHDRDFLYLAVRCEHPESEGTPAATTRTRDQDLRKFDRISLMLDLDRDYNTCFHFQIDARGCVAEDCWGDRTWDPKWFVAIHREPSAWTAEVAIPRSVLTGDHFTSGKAWAANVVRVIPGQGVQAFSLPAEAPEESLRPEGMGLLMFAQDQMERAEGRPTSNRR